MGKSYDQLDDDLIAFIKAQKIFFVATAPLAADGHVNVSPKGYDSLSVIDNHTVAYLDLGGSGIETQAHCQENGRITLMFCAFEGKANIVRIFGRGEAVPFTDPRFADLLKCFSGFTRARAIITIDIDHIMDSCGWGVPFFEFKGERDQLRRNVDFRPFEAWTEHRFNTNATSLDGLPGLTRLEASEAK
ncbi:MAG: pyridoxamine 5'-phosphate oxidase family protein [Robiginitomaculum sp.]|nr:pyridoxamine 5'-phosphate oxidase family protein [Robiginitomaculum sp.]MDQ7078074.1 pyridoxamine 5'-phosphate oxidase family protein [Robiginitomaculum sp.]